MYKNLTVTIIASIDGNNNWEYNEFLYNIQNSLYSPNVRYIVLEYFPAGRISVGGEDTRKQKANIKVLEKNNAFREYCLFDANIFDTRVLIGFFREYVLIDVIDGKKYDSKEDNRHFLFTWGHGAGIGFFRESVLTEAARAEEYEGIEKKGEIDKRTLDDVDSFDILKANFSVPASVAADSKPKVGRFLKTSIHESGGAYYQMLDAKDLEHVLMESFFKKSQIKVEILFTMNCFMQTFECGFALSKVVYYLFSSQIMMRSAGFDYASFFMLLTMNHNVSYDQIRDDIFENLPLKYRSIKNSPRYASYKNIPLTVSFNFLRNYTSMHNEVIIKLCDFLERNFIVKLETGKAIIEELIECRADLPDLNGVFKPLGFVDFLDIFNLIDSRIIKKIGNDGPRLNLGSIWQTIDIVKEECKMYCTTYEFASDTRRIPKMFSVFFPNFKETNLPTFVIELMMHLEKGKNNNRWTEFIFNVRTEYAKVKAR